LDPLALLLGVTYLIVPALSYTGHGLGRSFAFNFYCTGWDGERLLVARKEDVRRSKPLTSRVGIDPVWMYSDNDAGVGGGECDADLAVARADQERDSYASMLDFLAEPAQGLSLDQVALQLGLSIAEGQSARDALLEHTVAFDANVSELVHCLERPANADKFSCCNPVMHASYWRWMARRVLQAQCVMVTYQHWTWRGYKTWAERIDV
jgi:hypothetical protein